MMLSVFYAIGIALDVFCWCSGIRVCLALSLPAPEAALRIPGNHSKNFPSVSRTRYMSWFSGWVDVMFILLLYLNDIHDTTSNQEYDSWQMLYINMHYMLYMYIYIYTYTIHLCGDKTYDCIFCHRFTDWIRDKHQQVLPCSVLSIPSMVWGALAHLISFSDEQLNSLFKSVMHGQIYTDPICIYNIYTHIILALFCKKDLETWTFVLADCRSTSYSDLFSIS